MYIEGYIYTYRSKFVVIIWETVWIGKLNRKDANTLSGCWAGLSLAGALGRASRKRSRALNNLPMMATGDCEIHVHENALVTMICSTLLARCEWKPKAVFSGGGGGGGGGGRSVVAGGPPAMCFTWLARGSLHI